LEINQGFTPVLTSPNAFLGHPSLDASLTLELFGRFYEVQRYGPFGLPEITRLFLTNFGLQISLKLLFGTRFSTQAVQKSFKPPLVLNHIFKNTLAFGSNFQEFGLVLLSLPQGLMFPLLGI